MDEPGFFNVIKADQGEIPAWRFANLQETRVHAQCDKIIETDGRVDVRIIRQQRVDRLAAKSTR